MITFRIGLVMKSVLSPRVNLVDIGLAVCLHGFLGAGYVLVNGGIFFSVVRQHRRLDIFYQVERLWTAAVKTTAALRPRTCVADAKVISPPQQKPMSPSRSPRTSGRVRRNAKPESASSATPYPGARSRMLPSPSPSGFTCFVPPCRHRSPQRD